MIETKSWITRLVSPLLLKEFPSDTMLLLDKQGILVKLRILRKRKMTYTIVYNACKTWKREIE